MTGQESRTAAAQGSLLDRLLDHQPAEERDPPPSYSDSLTSLREAVRRDLEYLLNTRRAALSWPSHLSELPRSVVGYGVGDVSGQHLADSIEREKFRASIETAIRNYEPRFQSFSVTLADGVDEVNRMLGLRIEALLHAEPVPHAMIFNSVLEPSSQRFNVAEIRS